MALLDRVLDTANPVPEDAEWFEANYPQHRKTLFDFLVWLSEGNRHWAEEIEHLVAIQAWLKGRTRYREGGDVLGMLRDMARRLLQDYGRSDGKQPVALAPEVIELDHDTPYEHGDQLTEPFERFGHLFTPQELRVATLLFVRGLKQEETAAALGVTQGAVSQAVGRIREKITATQEGANILARSSRSISRRAHNPEASDSRNYVDRRRQEAEPQDLRDEWDGDPFPVVSYKL
jgi:RNA polymerase sigma-70 factor (ECF subfamily)